MATIIHIAPSNPNAKKITAELRQLTDTLTMNYNYDRIRLAIAEHKPAVILLSLTDLTNSEKETAERLLNEKSEIRFIIMGSQQECNEFFSKSCSSNISRYLMTPMPISDIINTVKQCIPKSVLAKSEPCKSEDNGSKKHILIVDDDVVFLRMMTNALKDDYRVSVAKSGTSAISLLGKDIPDLILLDDEMPILDGPHLMLLLQSEEQYKDIPVFFLTGQTDPGTVKRALVLGPVGYILKSSGQKVILKRINEFFTEVK